MEEVRIREAPLTEHEHIDAVATRRQLEVLCDEMSDAVVSVDGDGRVIALNPAAARLYNCSAAEAIGRSASEVTRAHQDTAIRLPVQGADGSPAGSLIFVRAAGQGRAQRDLAVIERASRAFAESLSLRETLDCVASVFIHPESITA